jgi:dolichyl-phosphate-mannose-protein mannosyltransferase
MYVCVLSVKWIGLFVTSVVGLYTLQDLWDKFGDLRMPIVSLRCNYFRHSCLLIRDDLLQKIYIRHWIARGVCLIILPLSIYMFCFKLHFLILNRSGPGDAQMSSLFQAHLHGNDFARNPLGE